MLDQFGGRFLSYVALAGFQGIAPVNFSGWFVSAKVNLCGQFCFDCHGMLWLIGFGESETLDYSVIFLSLRLSFLQLLKRLLDLGF